MALITIAGAIILYLIIVFSLYKLFEKFFKMLFFVITALFIIGLLYIIAKGV